MQALFYREKIKREETALKENEEPRTLRGKTHRPRESFQIIKLLCACTTTASYVPLSL